MLQDEFNNACRQLFLMERSSTVVRAVGTLIAEMVSSGRIDSVDAAVHWIDRIAKEELNISARRSATPAQSCHAGKDNQ